MSVQLELAFKSALFNIQGDALEESNFIIVQALIPEPKRIYHIAHQEMQLLFWNFYSYSDTCKNLARRQLAGVNNIISILHSLALGPGERRARQRHQSSAGRLEDTEWCNELQKGVNS